MIDYNKALYRRDNKGNPCIWYCEPNLSNNGVIVYHGILGKTITIEEIKVNRNPKDEIATRINAKRKSGHLLLSEVKDNIELPVEESAIIAFLTTYLPTDRSNSNSGAMLPMLAKIYDGSKGGYRIIQPKLNGLRCLIGATKTGADMFKPIRLTFQSRDGIYWDSLDTIETYLLRTIPEELLELMLNENYLLDGELYLYGYNVNQINSFVKNIKEINNQHLQFWCYDIAIPNMTQKLRQEVLSSYIGDKELVITSAKDHSDNLLRLVRVPNYGAHDHEGTKYFRDLFIKWGFEGAIERHPDEEYQFGKRNSAMRKYKKTTDGLFLVVDIVSEGVKRPDIPVLVLRNDINNSTFKVGIRGTQDYQRSVLIQREKYIAKLAFVEYGERSGIEQVPLHCKDVYFYKEAVGEG